MTPKLEKYQLFDIEKDPNELTDLAGLPARQSKVKRLRRSLAQWFHDQGDELFLK